MYPENNQINYMFRKGNLMDKGYVENGFIVDLAHSKKTSDVIYELSKILEMPEAKNKKICLKLGDMKLSETELVSIKTLVEIMDSQIEFISTSSETTTEAAKALGIEISQLGASVPALDISASEAENEEVNAELTNALDKIFGEGDFEERYPEENVEHSRQETNDTNANQAPAIETDIQIVTFEDAEELENIRKNDRETEKLPTLYIHRTLRSGQSLSSEGNIVIIGDVNPGAEIIAKGDITVWGILGGIAHAGSDGNSYSKIRALKLNAIQIRIGNVFARRPDTVNTPYIQRTDTYVPEEARVSKNHIVVYKLHEA